MANRRTNEAAWSDKYKRWSIKVQRDGTRKQFTSSLTGRKGKLDAERKADEWLLSGCMTTDNIKFGAAYKQFLEAKKRECGTSWYKQLDSYGRTWLFPKLEHKKVSKITMLDYKDCILTAYEDGKSHKTLTNIRGCITAFHAYCDEAGIEATHLRKIKIPDDAPRGEKHILQPDDLKVLFGVDTIIKRGQPCQCWYIHAWRLMVILGLRRGELCGLQRGDIADGKLNIKRSINHYCEVTQGKTKAAQRSIVIPAHAQAEIDAQLAMLKASGIVSPWLFPGGDGQVSNPDNFYDRWQVYCTQHDIKATLHELRHTHISLMQDVIPESALKRMVGHTPNMDTFGVYGHEVDGEAQKAAKIVDNIFDGIIQK